jgi:hypothetical protein
MKNRLRWSVIFLLSALALLIFYVALTAVPVRDLYKDDRSTVPVCDSAPYNTDAQVNALVQRAQIDYLLSPIPRWRGKLVFKEAHLAAPNDLYLIFMPAGEAENAVVYCCARESGRLLWKALWVRAA